MDSRLGVLQEMLGSSFPDLSEAGSAQPFLKKLSALDAALSSVRTQLEAAYRSVRSEKGDSWRSARSALTAANGDVARAQMNISHASEDVTEGNIAEVLREGGWGGDKLQNRMFARMLDHLIAAIGQGYELSKYLKKVRQLPPQATKELVDIIAAVNVQKGKLDSLRAKLDRPDGG